MSADPNGKASEDASGRQHAHGARSAKEGRDAPNGDDSVHVRFVRFDADTFEEHTDLEPEDLAARCEAATGVRWVHVTGVHAGGLTAGIAAAFDLHPLTLEDIVTPGQRPKLDAYDGYVFLVMRMLRPVGDAEAPTQPRRRTVRTEQLSIVLTDGVLLSFQQGTDDVFDALIERLRQGKGRARSMGVDFLAYLLLDDVVAGYLTALERMDEMSSRLEAELPHDTTTGTLQRVGLLKRDVQTVRRAAWPLREVVASLSHDEDGHVSAPVLTFMRDAHDHVIQTIDAIENLRELLNGLHDLYLSLSSNRMNEIMKVLTIISTIFIPLTFLVGVYGMNFHAMPELAWRWAYPALWLLMLGIGGFMLLLFRRARWL